MKFWIDRQAILSLIEESNYEKREEFLSYGDPRRKQYSIKQQAYALSLIPEHGIRGVSRILKIPRMTIQRWCRRINYPVPRCPQWVYERPRDGEGGNGIIQMIPLKKNRLEAFQSMH